MKPQLYVFYFDRDGSGKYIPQLNRLRAGLVKAGCTTEPILLTDTTTAIPSGWLWERHDPLKWLGKYHRGGIDGAQWDYKACLLMAKYEEVQPGPAVYLDADNIIHGDPMPELEALPVGTFALGPDGGGRTIVHPAFPRKTDLLEHSTSIMVMPADGRNLCDFYRQLWDSSTEPTHYLLEQRTWSLVLHGSLGRLLPRAFAWSKLWGMPPPLGTLLEHPHGPRKWVGVEA